MGTEGSNSLLQVRQSVAKRRKYKALVDEQEDRLSGQSDKSYDSNDSDLKLALKLRELDIE